MTSETVYATVEQLKAQPGVTGGDDDTVMALMLEAASRTIDGFCNRERDGFLASIVPSARLFVGSGMTYQWIDECVEVVSVAVKFTQTQPTYTSLAGTDWLPFKGGPDKPNFNLGPWTGIMAQRPGTIGYWPNGWIGTYGWIWPSDRVLVDDEMLPKLPTVEVSARWGYANAIPPQVTQATITQAARWFKRGQSFWADSAASSDFGVMQYRRELDPDVKMMLQLGRLVRPSYTVVT